MNTPPPVRGTARTLIAGTLVAVVLFVASLILAAANLVELSVAAAVAGVIALIATPALGLVVTALELRPTQPRAALLAVVVLAVLGVATVVALAFRET